MIHCYISVVEKITFIANPFQGGKRIVHPRDNATISCQANDVTAKVYLSVRGRSYNETLEYFGKRLYEINQIFTISTITLHDGGEYLCGVSTNGTMIKELKLGTILVDRGMY